LLAQLGSRKTAIIHRWLAAPRRAERLLESVIEVCLASDVFAICDFINQRHRHLLHYKRRPQTSLLQHLPFSQKHYRPYLPFMPPVVEQSCLRASDVILSNSHAVLMGVITGPNQLHICDVHTPQQDGWHLRAFVIAPVKALEWVSPVIPFGKGEALECIRERAKHRSRPTSPLENRGKNPSSQRIEHVSGTVDEFSPASCSQNAGRFSNSEFRKRGWLQFLPPTLMKEPAEKASHQYSTRGPLSPL
jgi:hypothetical protein